MCLQKWGCLFLFVGLFFAEMVCAVEEKALVEDEESVWDRLHSKTTVGIYSAYLYRGRILCDEPVWQPSEKISFDLPEEMGSVHAFIWSNWNLNKNNKPGRFGGLQSLDYILNYTKSFGPVDFDVGHFWYTYPNSGSPSTAEFFVGAKWRNAFVTPTVYLSWDYADTARNGTDALYAEFDFSHDFRLNDRLTFTLSSGFSIANQDYMEFKCGVNKTEFATFKTAGALSYRLTDSLTVGASLAYWYELSHTVRHSTYDCEDAYNQILVGGVNASLFF